MAVKPGPDEREGNRLRDEYKRANLRYKWAARELHRQAQAAVSHEDFSKLAKYVREARAETAEARRALKSFESGNPINIGDSLRQEYHAAVQNFRASIYDLVILVDGNSATDSDFNLAHLRIMAARRACEAARESLENHQAEHGR
jgi:hypothetical protein